MMEHVFSWNEEENEDESRLITITFPKLENLRLYDLPNLIVIYQGIESIQCPLLTRIAIMDCPQLNGPVSNFDGDDSHPLQLLRKENSRELPLMANAKIMNTFSPQISVGSFAQLEHLRIGDFDNIKSLFSFSIAQGLGSLEYLRIENCRKMVMMIEEDEEIIGQSSRDHHQITFPRLKFLDLVNLPRLTNFYKGIDTITLPLLTEIEMVRFPNMECIVSTTTLISGDINNKVVGKLKEQTIYYSLLICNLFPMDNFTRLETLTIESFDKISFLFSTPIADNLINLKKLIIKSCKNLVNVVEEEIDESHEASLLFPHLENLYLDELPKLKIFCEWRCALELPLLEEMKIYGCREMERFSLRSLSTPNLNNIYREFNFITVTGDLNDVLQQHFSIKGESTSGEGVEDREDKDETKEEESTSSELSVGQEDREKGEIKEQKH